MSGIFPAYFDLSFLLIGQVECGAVFYLVFVLFDLACWLLARWFSGLSSRIYFVAAMVVSVCGLFLCFCPFAIIGIVIAFRGRGAALLCDPLCYWVSYRFFHGRAFLISMGFLE